MKKNGKLSLILAALLLSGSALSSCSDAGTPGNSDAPEAGGITPAAEEQPVEEPAEEEFATDQVPELDFGGATVNMAGQGTAGANNELDMWVAELTGDVVSDAIFQRNVAMEDRFKVVIAEPLMNDYTTISNTIKSMVTAGDDTYDFVLNQLAQTSADVLNGYSMNLNEIPYLDFSMRWYPANVLESASLNGKLFLMVSDMCISYVGQTWSMCFNKDLTTDLGIEDLYSVAREGEWTIDKLRELSSDVYFDVNGDGAKDAKDTYGFTMGSGLNGCMGGAFLYGAGQRYMDVNSDFTINHLMGSEHAQAVAEKFYELNNSAGSTVYTADGKTLKAMMDRIAVFAPSQLGHYYTTVRDFEGTFGVLPMPKFDAAQESYATLCDAGCNCISVPITCRNPELTGAMIEAMSAYSTNNVIPAYVDVSLQTKIARDEESVEMMQIVLDSRVMDFGYLYCGWNGWTWQLADLFKDPGNYVSNYQKREKMMTKTYEKIISEFMDGE